MKGPTQVRADITRHLTNNWHTDITGTTTTWPKRLPLGAPARADLDAGYSTFLTATRDLQAWASTHNLSLDYTNRRVSGTTQAVPTHVTVPTLDDAAAVAADGWPTRLRRARHRNDLLTQRTTHQSADLAGDRTAGYSAHRSGLPPVWLTLGGGGS